MTLGELKKSLSRMSPDLDDVEVFINYVDADSALDFDCLAFTSYMDIPETESIVLVLGTDKAAHKRISTGTLHYRDGSKPTDTNEE